MSQSTRFGKSLCGLISYDIRVSESAETPGSPADRRTNHERVTFPKAAGWIGLLALAVGLFQVAWAAKDLLPSGIFHDPRTESQLRLLFDQGALSAFSGGVLSIGGFHLDWTKQRPRKTGGPSNTSPEPGWHRTLLAVAVLIVFGILALSILPTPSRDVAFSPRDFQPLAQPINVKTYGAYRVLRNFWADQGGVLAVDVQITWTDNRTGGILFNGTPGTHEGDAASESGAAARLLRIRSAGGASRALVPGLGHYERAAEERESDQRDPSARPDSGAEGRHARNRGHDRRADGHAGDQECVEQSRHQTVLLRIRAARNEGRSRREDKSVADSEEGHQDEERREGTDERDAGHRDRDRNQADRRGRRGAVPVCEDPRGIVEQQREDRERGEAQADGKCSVPELLLEVQRNERNERAQDEVEAEDRCVAGRGRRSPRIRDEPVPGHRPRSRLGRLRNKEQRCYIPEKADLKREFPPKASGDPAEEQVRGRMDGGEEADDDPDRHQVCAHMLRIERDHRNERVRVHRSEHRRGEQIQGPPPGHDWRDARNAQKDEPTRFT